MLALNLVLVDVAVVVWSSAARKVVCQVVIVCQSVDVLVEFKIRLKFRICGVVWIVRRVKFVQYDVNMSFLLFYVCVNYYQICQIITKTYVVNHQTNHHYYHSM